MLDPFIFALVTRGPNMEDGLHSSFAKSSFSIRLVGIELKRLVFVALSRTQDISNLIRQKYLLPPLIYVRHQFLF